MKSKVLMIALLLQAMLLQSGIAEEFPIGAYVHRPDTSVLRQANFDWMVMILKLAILPIRPLQNNISCWSIATVPAIR